VLQFLLLAIEAGSSQHLSLIPDVTYHINITISTTAVQQYSTLIVQAHTQKNLITLASKNLLVVNGSHVGLVHLLSEELDRLDYYVICYRHGNDKNNVVVMIVAQLLENEGVFVCVCVPAPEAIND